MRTITLLFLIAVLSACSGLQPGSLQGRISGADGRVPAMAHVHLFKLGDDPYKPITSVRAGTDGRFRLQLPDDEYLAVLITAADHQALELPLIRNGSESVKLNIRLQSNDYVADFSQVKITGDWNNFGFSSALPMQRRADGTFTFSLQTDSAQVAYQLVGITSDGHSVNGTQYDRLQYDGGGDYLSLVSARQGRADIVFDPRKLIRQSDDDLPQVSSPGGGRPVRFMEVALRCAREQRLSRSAEAAFKKNVGNTTRYQHDYSSLVKYLSDLMDASSDDKLIKYAALSMAELVYYDAMVPDRVFRTIAKSMPLTDPMWAAKPMLAPYVYIKALGEKPAQALFNEQLEKITNPRVQAIVLINLGLQAKRDRDDQKLAEVYNALKENHSDIPQVQYYLQQFDANQRIALGKKVPEFSFTLLNSTQTVNNKTFEGKFYMLDFWATWCQPCVAEMPTIHDAYAKYHSKGFEILSLSFDRQQEDIARFRNSAWKMPWLHTFLDPSIRDQVAQTFEVEGIPKPILVSPEGVIIATEAELRGDKLERTLGTYLD